MPNDISSVQCKLIGISCLEGELRQNVRKEWDDRVSGYDTLWVDAEASDKTLSLVEKITNLARDTENEIQTGQNVLVAVFLDLTKDLDEALLKEIMVAPKKLTQILGCVVPLTLEFGYLAKFAFGDSVALKANVQKVVDINMQDITRRAQLCMVGISPLWRPDEDISWKSVMVALDLLRRNAAPAAMMPMEGTNACSNFGFLRYGEYDEQKLKALEDDKMRLAFQMGNGGRVEFEKELATELSAIEQKVQQKYAVYGKLQPVHPQMSPSGMFDKMAAKKGKGVFADARAATQTALTATAKNLKATIAEDYRKQIETAPEYLTKFLEKAHVGIDLESDRKVMEEILAPRPIGVNEAQLPALNYREAGDYNGEMDAFLKDLCRYEAAKCRYEFSKALLEAYRAIPDSVYDKRKEALNKEKRTVDNLLSRHATKQQLIGIIAAGDVLPKTAFNVTMAAGHSSYWAMTRDASIAEELDYQTAGLMTKVYYIDPKYGGLKKLDNAPLKALHMLQFTCNEAILNNIIG